jgi:hypothetical protein
MMMRLRTYGESASTSCSMKSEQTTIELDDSFDATTDGLFGELKSLK